MRKESVSECSGVFHVAIWLISITPVGLELLEVGHLFDVPAKSCQNALKNVNLTMTMLNRLSKNCHAIRDIDLHFSKVRPDYFQKVMDSISNLQDCEALESIPSIGIEFITGIRLLPMISSRLMRLPKEGRSLSAWAKGNSNYGDHRPHQARRP